MRALARYFLCISIFVAAAQAGVTVAAPAAGISASSPVHFIASATPTVSTNQIKTMRIYVDNVSAYLISAATIDTTVAMPNGTHKVVVQAWDTAGTVYKSQMTLTRSEEHTSELQ